jgi:stringent starvation protein B
MSSFRTALFDAVYDWILDNDYTPYVLADTSSSTVSVPREYTHNGRIILNIHPRSIDGLIVDEEGISFTARFNGVSRPVVLPAESMLALYARETNEGAAFHGNFMVTEMLQDLPPAPVPVQTARSNRPHLRLVK